MAKNKRRMAGVKNKRIVREGDVCRVVPGHVSIKQKRDSVHWRAVNVDAAIWFPTGEPFGWRTKTVKQGETVNSGKASVSGNFPYAVYCAASAEFAVGGSDPEIIVKR